MKKVYVLIEYLGYEDFKILGVFPSRKHARMYWRKEWEKDTIDKIWNSKFNKVNIVESNLYE